MSDYDDKGNIIITGHVLIRDTETGKILLNKSESSLVKENTKQIEGDNNNAR